MGGEREREPGVREGRKRRRVRERESGTHIHTQREREIRWRGEEGRTNEDE